MERRRIVHVVTALLIAGGCASAYVYLLYWRHLPAQYLPFTRAWLYSADVDDARLAKLSAEDLGAGEMSRAPGLPPCTAQPDATTAPPTDRMVLRDVAVAQNPVALATQCGSNVLWVAEQNGKVRPLVDDQLGPAVLDITQRLFRPASGKRGWEAGLEGIAFSPDGSRLYLSFSDETGATRVSEFPAPSGPTATIDATKERPIIAVAQPDDRHNGGTIRFGPDGFLYFGLGDGGARCGIMSAFPKRLYGKMLRIDPRKQPNGSYGIPASNPFVGASDELAPRPEVWVTGLRNPWAFAVDSVTGTLWISDVGEFDREEVNLVPTASAGIELGWPKFEGELGPRQSCMFEWDVANVSEPILREPRTPDTKPFYAYAHRPYSDAEKRCSVTGGDVYHGAIFTPLRDKFVFADFCSGEVLAIGPADAEPIDTGVRVPLITALAQDHQGYLWATEYNGKIRRIEPAP